MKAILIEQANELKIFSYSKKNMHFFIFDIDESSSAEAMEHLER